MKKKKIAILGSTGSIGKSSLEIIKLNKKNFNIELLSANSNYKEICNQIKLFKPSYFVIANYLVYVKVKSKVKNKRIKIFNNFKDIPSKLKFDITIAAIVGIAGLEPTIQFSKQSKKILLANKESIICGWHILSKIIKKNKTKLIPIDSEHFSINQLTHNYTDSDIKKIYITASGGPFLRRSLRSFKKIKPNAAYKHPNWNMGKKISIDSATLMNKVFEIIEAQRIFNIDINKFEILIHPKSYIHSIVKFINGQIKILAHDTDMRIPIFNSIYQNKLKKINTKPINVNLLNNLNLKKIDLIRYPSVKILKKINNNNTLFETLLISANDELVDLYIKNKIKFTEINIYLRKILNNKKYSKLTTKKPKKISDIINLSEEVRLKTRKLCIQ